MHIELFISLRYLFTKRKEKFISLISLISMLGIAIGVAALIVVIAVMSGFDRDLREKIVGNYSHLTVSGYSAITQEEYRQVSAKLSGNPHVIGVSPYIAGQVMIKEGNRFFAVALKGIDPASEPQVSRLDKYMVRGKLTDLAEGSIIIGKELAASLLIGPGKEITVYSPTGKEYKLKAAGIFNSGMYDYDLNLTFASLKTAQDIYGLNAQVLAIAVKLDNMYLAERVRDALSISLGPNYYIKTWGQMNRNFFAALKLEKLAMFIILALIVLVAAFNIISTLIVLVVEKTKDIGVLKSLGMSSAAIRRVFTYHGMLLGLGGTFLGAAGGIGLCWLLKKYQFVRLPQDIYYLDKIPVSLNWFDLSLIVLAAIAITLASTFYPAWRAARFTPVEALRYE